MSMLVSDYDGTYANGERNINLNSYAINGLLSTGHTFVLSSGRSYESLLRKTRINEIPYSYLGCADGNFLFDSEGNLLQGFFMSHEIIDKIEKLKKAALYERIDYTYEREYSTIYKPNEKLGSISFVVKESNRTDELLEEYNRLKEENPDYNFMPYSYNGTIYFMIRPKGVSKSSPIIYLQDKLQIPNSEIFTIGDGDNDLEMIRDYNGFVIGDNKALHEVALGEYHSVHALADDIAKKKVKRR
ncbi:MAG: HAD family phosphatase [Bacilli bacterium]|nr:HAD family phosphatase [Bacilli bacterium]